MGKGVHHLAQADAIAWHVLTSFIVIARSVSDDASQFSFAAVWIASLALAMTA
jgi:hypothetical protein